jgi:hypothetical protein
MFFIADYLPQIQRWVFLVAVIFTIYFASRWYHIYQITKKVRGFRNIKSIKFALQKIFLSLSPAGVLNFSKDLAFLPSETILNEDKTIWVQKEARRMAEHFGISTSTVVVTFRSDLKAPGCVELSPSSEFFVDLQSNLKDSPNEILSTLAHEVTHIFLFKHGIKMEPVFHNEVLTDTAAIFLGCGAALINGSSLLIKRSGDSETSSLRKLGYLSVDEFGYVLAKREKYFGKKTEQKINKGLPRSGYSSGRTRVIIEKGISRICAIKKLSRVAGLFQKQEYAEPDSKFIFPCSFCGQQLRVPALNKKLETTCPVCRTKNICYC